MRETTAEIWIGEDQSSDWMGTQGGINPTHLLLLRENSRPAWMLMSGNLHDSPPPVIGRAKVWVPSFQRPLEDALLLFATMGARLPEVRAVLSEFHQTKSRNKFDIDHLFPKGLPKQIYEASRKHLKDWHVVVSASSGSFATKDLAALAKYKGLNIEVRLPSVIHRRVVNE